MEQDRPRSSLSLASSASTTSSLSSPSTKKPTRAVHRVHAFGKRNNALRRDPNLPVHIRGWLHKQDSSGLRLWKRRWFVLSGHCLFYYKDSREESVLGSVLLPSYSIRPDGPGAPRGRRFTFTAEHPGMRTYVLAADTLEDLRGWLRALGRASRAEGEDWLFSSLSRPPSPLSLPRPRSAPARRPPLSAGEIQFPARPHTPLSRIDVRPPLDWGPQRQTLSRPPTPRRGPPTEAGGGRPPRSPQPWRQEPRTQSTQVSSGSSTYLQLPPRPPGTRASMILLPGPPADSTLHQSLETDTLLTKLCGQDRLLRRIQEDLDKRQEEKEQLEAALELTRQQLGQATREAAASGKAWGRQRLLQDRLVNVRATLCHLAQEREQVWDTYSGLEQDLGTLRETLEYLLHLGSPQDRAAAQQQLWMVEDTLAGLGGPQKQPPHTEPKSPSPAPQGEESSEQESLPESLELSAPQSPEVDWGQPPGGDRALLSPRSGVESPRVSRASSPEGRQPSSLNTKVPVARPRMSAQEQLERMRRNQACGLPFPRPASPRLLTLGRALSPAGRQLDLEQRSVVGAAQWLRSSGSWSSSRPSTTCMPTPKGHRERVLSLSQALATEASQWRRLMTGSPGVNSDSRGDCLPPGSQPPSKEVHQVTSSPASPKANSAPGSRRGLAQWEPSWDPGTTPAAPLQDQGAWPLRVTLLQSSF
ncbi:pleckstrin homology domain-containing family A member 4 isoform X5 [Chionomys nivalis]|uniref:pleckstrin homology domain-containing family A member 4 isoform X5 n=1 Tax=Chionomys nivalis TaxID=269649 RepID=UPI0025929935|nr:pleckstrin homology domain-containing family A member 4 isoform X5 [Chionomys nivalis]